MTDTDKKVIALLSEALTLERLQSASSAAGTHICTALNTFGKAGQDEIRKANAARANRTASSTAKPTVAQDPRSWNPAESLGKFPGLPTREVIQSNPQAQASSPAKESPRSGNKSVPVVEISVSKDADTAVKMSGFEDLTTATEMPKRPTKVLEAYGIEQIKMYLELMRVEIPDEANDKEIAAMLIQNFKPGK